MKIGRKHKIFTNMKHMIEIKCINTGTTITVEQGTSLAQFAATQSQTRPVLCAWVNNRARDLGYVLYESAQVALFDITHPSAWRCYVRSLCFLLYKAVVDTLPATSLRIEHAVSNGYYCRLGDDAVIDESLVARIKERMQQLVAADLPFVRHRVPREEAIELFAAQGMNDKVRLLQSTTHLYTTYHSLGDTIDQYYSVLVPSTGLLALFDLVAYEEGMLLIPPLASDVDNLGSVLPQPHLFATFRVNRHFNRVVGVGDVAGLNRIIHDNQTPDLIRVTEALQEKQIAAIADEIARRCNEIGESMVVLIAGPTSSGKTTFAKRLSIQLMTSLLRPVALSLDDYFVDREQTPRDAYGEYDYESLYAEDLPLFNRQMAQLLAGEEVATPTYNFLTGKKEYLGNTTQLTSSSVLILEGMHALNPELTPQIPTERKYLIYVSALTSLTLDDHNWVATTDNRLLRRIVRDFKYRGYSAAETIARWGSVRRGEEQWVFPFQEHADAMFNSSLLFEVASLKPQAEVLLRSVPCNVPQYAEAQRLLTFLSYLQPLDEQFLPRTSLLREFLGGSSFSY